MNASRILIACIGNIFLGDDAFGLEVFQRLVDRTQPAGVRVVDFGIRGLDLTYALLEEWDIVILVDAAPRGHAPGTLYLIEPPQVQSDSSLNDPMPGNPLIDAHGMDPVKVLRAVGMMGGSLKRLLVVGCEPMPLNSDEEMQMELSPPVAAAVPEAVEMIESLIAKLIGGADAPLLSERNEEVFTKGDVTHGVAQRTG
jgi:hydrogenase maturation protease